MEQIDTYIHGFIAYLKNERRYSIHTLKAYKNDLCAFKVFLVETGGGGDLFSISKRTFERFLAAGVEGGMSKRTIARRLATLGSFYRYWSRKTGLPNPVKGIKAPKGDKPLPEFLPVSDLEKIKMLFDNELDFSGERDKAIFYTFLFTGMRRSELAGLQASDIDFYRNQIRVMGKRAKERFIPLHPNLTEILQSYLKQRNDIFEGDDWPNHVFLSLGGKPISPESVYKIIKTLLGKVSTRAYRGPHLLRHTFATWILDKGADINAVKELLGHSSLAATQVYTHNTLDKLRKVYFQAHPKA
jgi:integrase/recombinase XerC